GFTHQREFAEILAVELHRRRGERMNPKVGFAAGGGETDPCRVIERRRLIGHQRRAGDPAEVERRLVDGKDAEIDKTWGDQPSAGVNHIVAGPRDNAPHGVDHPVDAPYRSGLHPTGSDQVAADDRERARLLHAQPSTPRARRVKTSRQAMRIATPISTCSVMIERSGKSATVLSISTPRFIGPGCITIASGAARDNRSGVSP